MSKRRISRRRFLENTGTAIAAVAAAPALKVAQPAANATAAGQQLPVALTVNGQVRRVDVDARWTLAELLRDHLNLTGTKIRSEERRVGEEGRSRWVPNEE